MPAKKKKASKKPLEQGVQEVAGEEEYDPAEQVASQAVQDAAVAAPEAVPEGGATVEIGKESEATAASTIKGALPAFSLSEVPLTAPCICSQVSSNV